MCDSRVSAPHSDGLSPTPQLSPVFCPASLFTQDQHGFQPSVAQSAQEGIEHHTTWEARRPRDLAPAFQGHAPYGWTSDKPAGLGTAFEASVLNSKSPVTMVVLDRLRKSKSPALFASPIAADTIPPQRPVSPQLFAAPTPETSPTPLVYPPALARKLAWTTRTAKAQTVIKWVGRPVVPPFLARKPDGEYAARYHLDQPDLNKPSSEGKVNTRKKQRRSTLLSLPASYTRSTASIGDLLETRDPGPKPRKASRAHLFGDFTLPYKSPRIKRTSLAQHKTASSFDASQLVQVYTTAPLRPSSSSQPCAPSVKTPKLAVEPFPPYAWGHIGDGRVPQSQPTECRPASNFLRMGPSDSIATAVDRRSNSGGRKRGNSTSEVDKRKGKEGKGRWLSQLKEWVSVSEPSTQALKQHKKDTYKRAGIALDDPRAGAKLHIPTTTLPSDAIKPYGRGPEPEEIAKRRTENKKRLRQSFSTTGGTSQGSRSSTSQHSSMSSLPMHYLREDV
ncbi:uncharacterized protein PG998_001998 [Apiospora kogelbergensis]|uniref:uncharacterized protein n=1 Tax=Apiospora kogelbergensis TaxID=1337665 RepID=UPI003131BBFC